MWFAEYNNHAVARIDGSYSQLPTTTIDSGPSGTTTDTTATFTFHSDDPAATFECRLDAAPFAACTSPDTIAGLADGQHTFVVRAVNAAGPDTSPPSRVWTVAPAPPGNTGRPSINSALDCGATIGGGCKAIPSTYDCDPGTWDGVDPSIPYTYEWQRLTPDNSYLSGYRADTVATGQRFYAQRSSLQAVAASESWLFQCVVTAYNAAGSSAATSPSVTLNPAPAPPPSSLNPTVDIRVTGIEVTQGVQTEIPPKTEPINTPPAKPTSQDPI